MKKANDLNIKDAIQQMLQVYHIKQKFDRTSIAAHWEELVGKPVANRTQEVFIKENTLFIRIESAVVKNELMLMRSKLLSSINERIGYQLVQELVFL